MNFWENMSRVLEVKRFLLWVHYIFIAVGISILCNLFQRILISLLALSSSYKWLESLSIDFTWKLKKIIEQKRSFMSNINNSKLKTGLLKCFYPETHLVTWLQASIDLQNFHSTVTFQVVVILIVFHNIWVSCTHHWLYILDSRWSGHVTVMV